MKQKYDLIRSTAMIVLALCSHSTAVRWSRTEGSNLEGSYIERTLLNVPYKASQTSKEYPNNANGTVMKLRVIAPERTPAGSARVKIARMKTIETTKGVKLTQPRSINVSFSVAILTLFSSITIPPFFQFVKIAIPKILN